MDNTNPKYRKVNEGVFWVACECWWLLAMRGILSTQWHYIDYINRTMKPGEHHA